MKPESWRGGGERAESCARQRARSSMLDIHSGRKKMLVTHMDMPEDLWRGGWWRGAGGGGAGKAEGVGAAGGGRGRQNSWVEHVGRQVCVGEYGMPGWPALSSCTHPTSTQVPRPSRPFFLATLQPALSGHPFADLPKAPIPRGEGGQSALSACGRECNRGEGTAGRHWEAGVVRSWRSATA